MHLNTVNQTFWHVLEVYTFNFPTYIHHKQGRYKFYLTHYQYFNTYHKLYNSFIESFSDEKKKKEDRSPPFQARDLRLLVQGNLRRIYFIFGNYLN